MAGDPDMADDSVTESRQPDQEEHEESLDRDSQQREPDSGRENDSQDTLHPETPSERRSSDSINVDGNLDPAETHENAVPRTDSSPEQHRADIHNAPPELMQRIREHAAGQRDNESRLKIPGSPPTPRYFRPEFPYEKQWKVHRAGMGLKRPKIKSIGRFNPEILLRRNQDTENDHISQAVTVPPVLRMETAAQNSPPRLFSNQQHIAGVREQTSPSHLNYAFSQGLHTTTVEPVIIRNASSSSLLSDNENNNDPQPKEADVQREQKLDQPSAVESPDKNIQLPTSHPSIKVAQTCRWISATAGDFADKDRQGLYQLLSEVPCSSKQADELDQLYLRQIGKDKSENDADPAVPDRTTSKYQFELSNTTEPVTQWAAGSTQSASLEDVASPETVYSHDLTLTTSLLSEASRRLHNMVKPPSTRQRDQTVLLPPSGSQSRPSPTVQSRKRKNRDEESSEEDSNKRRRMSPPLPTIRSQQDVCEGNGTRRRRASSATPAGRKRKRTDQTETDESDEEIKRRRT